MSGDARNVRIHLAPFEDILGSRLLFFGFGTDIDTRFHSIVH